MNLSDRLMQYEQAFKKLEEVIQMYNDDAKEVYVDAMIQRFEFCTELSWKLLKKYLEQEKLGEFYSPKSVIKESFKQKLLDGGEIWLDILDDRNLTSHTYDEVTANRIRDNIMNKYIYEFGKLLNVMKEKI